MASEHLQTALVALVRCCHKLLFEQCHKTREFFAIAAKQFVEYRGTELVERSIDGNVLQFKKPLDLFSLFPVPCPLSPVPATIAHGVARHDESSLAGRV